MGYDSTPACYALSRLILVVALGVVSVKTFVLLAGCDCTRVFIFCFFS